MELDPKKLQREMNTQDNLITAHPLFCVFEKEYIYGMDSDYSDQYKWLDCEGDELVDVDPDEEEAGGKHKVYYRKIDRFVAAHFTMKAAKLYIEENRHNLTEPFTYVKSLYRCHEMIAIQEYFKTKELI